MTRYHPKLDPFGKPLGNSNFFFNIFSNKTVPVTSY